MRARAVRCKQNRKLHQGVEHCERTLYRRCHGGGPKAASQRQMPQRDVVQRDVVVKAADSQVEAWAEDED